MLFFPFRLDLSLYRFPIFTLLLCAFCVFMFVFQKNSAEDIYQKVDAFCANEHERTFYVVVEKLTGGRKAQNCANVFLSIAFSRTPESSIDAIAKETATFSTFSERESYRYVKEKLLSKYGDLSPQISGDVTVGLMYYPGSYNLKNMIMASFIHADWSHLIGNLVFFFAFSAAIEVVLGYMGFLVLVVFLSIGTHLSYSFAVAGMSDSLPTLGLSGVVMGMIGVFVFLMPGVKIRCFLWVLLFVRIVRIPAWVLAVWYIGWDIYNLSQSELQSNVNYIAHVSGAAIGYLGALVFMRGSKEVIAEELKRHEDAKIAAGILS